MSISIPQADFTPQLAGYPGQGAFRFWCQKVLPIVYDDSLSYYELLNKVVNYLNNVIADVRSMGDNIGALSGAFDNLQGFVNEELQATAREINTFENSTNTRVDQFIETVNHALTTFQEFLNEYFDNLDVQEEINNKLDEMARNGDLTALVRPIITEQAPNIISDWLEENITPTSPAVDASLSVSGAAADAKVVGEFRTAEKEENEFLETILTNTSKSYVEKVYDVPVDKFSTLNSVAVNNENTEIISGGGNGIVFPVLAGVIVRIKKPVQTSVCQVCFTAEYPAEDVSITHDNVFSGVVNTDISVTSNSGDKYVFLYVGTRSVSEVLEGLEVSLKPIDESSRIEGICKDSVVAANNELFRADSEILAADNLTYTGFRLDITGRRVSDSSYKIMLFRVYSGTVIKVVSDDKFQFQNSYNVVATGTPPRIGRTYGSGTFFMDVPNGALYVAVSTPTVSNASVYWCLSVISDLQTERSEENEFLETILTNTSKSYIEKISDVPVDKFSTLNSVAVNNENAEIISGGGNGIVFPVLAGVIVRIKKPVQTSVCQVCFTAEYPAEDVSITHDNVFSGVVNTDISVTSNSGDKYVFLYVGTRSVSEVLEGLEVSLKPIDDSSRPGDIFGVDIINALSTVYNAYTSQVSDIPYSKTPTIGTSLSIDTENLKLVSGSGAGVIVPVIEGTSVRVKKPQTTVCVACFTREPPKAGTSITHYTSFTGYANTDIVAGSNSGDKYLYVYTGSTTINANDVEVMYSQTLAGVAEYLPHLDKHMINMLKYRPVGKVSKPYIALSCDDGLEPLATYTLPRIQYWNNYYNTNIPLHMALFNNSPVLTNPTYKELVVDMCENHNCSIGIHGPSPFENYETLELYNFLQKQEQFITDTTGISPSSIIYPHSSYNDLIMTMCGSWYNICGASGEVPSPFTYSDNNGLAFYVGEKSNCYEVYRLSILDQQIVGDSGIEAVIDYAYDHNLIICPYFHDIAFTNYDDYTNNYNRARLDKFISYGMQKGIEFINFGDIPSLL